MSLKLCIVTPCHWKAAMGGSQYQAKVLIDYLLKHYDVEITYLTLRADPSYRPSEYEIIKFSSTTGLRRYALFFDALRLWRALDRVKPDIILQVVASAHTGIAAFYARRAGCRMVWRVSSDRSIEREPLAWWRIHKWIERRFLDYGIRNAHVILAQTHYQRKQLASHFGRDDAVVVPNFHPFVPATPPRRKLPYQVAWVASLKPLKNPAAFVRLARRLEHREDIDFVMMGRPDEDNDWTTSLLREIEAQSNIRYLGELTQEETNRTLEHSDLLVNTSDFEGFSNTFIQAWMRGVPVVSLRVDPDRLLSSGRLGAASGSEERLWRDVAALLDAPEEREEMGRRCRKYALENHSEANIDDLAHLLCVPAARQPAVAEPA